MPAARLSKETRVGGTSREPCRSRLPAVELGVVEIDQATQELGAIRKPYRAARGLGALEVGRTVVERGSSYVDLATGELAGAERTWPPPNRAL